MYWYYLISYNLYDYYWKISDEHLKFYGSLWLIKAADYMISCHRIYTEHAHSVLSSFDLIY